MLGFLERAAHCVGVATVLKSDSALHVLDLWLWGILDFGLGLRVGGLTSVPLGCVPVRSKSYLKPEALNPKPEACNPTSKARSPESKTQNPLPCSREARRSGFQQSRLQLLFRVPGFVELRI